MRKKVFYSFTIIGLLMLSVTGCAKPAPPPTPLEEKPPVKIGALIPYTGMGAFAASYLEQGIEFVFDEAGWEVAGRKIILVKEDETDDPTLAVAKAKKLVEHDQVDVIMGLLMGHTAGAVSAYLEPLKVPQLSCSVCLEPTSRYAFYIPGTGKGNAYPIGPYCYDELGARTAALLYMDAIYGYANKDAFIEGFTARGGTIVSDQAIPMGTMDLAPYLEGIGEPDIVAVQLNMPTDIAFVRQYREFGLKMPVFFISNAPQGEPVLAQMGDSVLGMYGASLYSPLIDTPFNKQFVEKYEEKYGLIPEITTHDAHVQAAVIIEALKATGGDTSYDKMVDALLGIRDLENPGGTFSFSPGRIGINDLHIFKAIKIGERYAWDPIKMVPAVEPR